MNRCHVPARTPTSVAPIATKQAVTEDDGVLAAQPGRPRPRPAAAHPEASGLHRRGQDRGAPDRDHQQREHPAPPGAEPADRAVVAEAPRPPRKADHLPLLREHAGEAGGGERRQHEPVGQVEHLRQGVGEVGRVGGGEQHHPGDGDREDAHRDSRARHPRLGDGAEQSGAEPCGRCRKEHETQPPPQRRRTDPAPRQRRELEHERRAGGDHVEAEHHGDGDRKAHPELGDGVGARGERRRVDVQAQGERIAAGRRCRGAQRARLAPRRHARAAVMPAPSGRSGRAERAGRAGRAGRGDARARPGRRRERRRA